MKLFLGFVLYNCEIRLGSCDLILEPQKLANKIKINFISHIFTVKSKFISVEKILKIVFGFSFVLK